MLSQHTLGTGQCRGVRWAELDADTSTLFEPESVTLSKRGSNTQIWPCLVVESNVRGIETVSVDGARDRPNEACLESFVDDLCTGHSVLLGRANTTL